MRLLSVCPTEGRDERLLYEALAGRLALLRLLSAEMVFITMTAPIIAKSSDHPMRLRMKRFM